MLKHPIIATSNWDTVGSTGSNILRENQWTISNRNTE